MLLSNDPKHQELFDYFHTGRKVVYQKGEIILRAGDEPTGVYLVETGYIKAYSLSKEGTEHTHIAYHPGEIFPVMWLMVDAVRNVYYQVIAETTVWIVPKSELKEFISQNNRMAMALLEQTTDMFRLYAGRIDNLMYSNSYERTAYRLLSLLDRMGKQVDGEWLIRAPVTHQDIAGSVNLTRETVSRAMERMKRKGFIAYDDSRRIVIKDIPGLMKIIGYDEAVGMWPQLAEYVPKDR